MTGGRSGFAVKDGGRMPGCKKKSGAIRFFRTDWKKRLY
jgi:hypothetical protein